MKVKMKEVYQGSGVSGVLAYDGITVSVFEIGEIYIVDEQTGNYLLEHRKAVEVLPVKSFPEFVEPVVLENVTHVMTETVPIVEEPKRKRGKK